MNTAFLIDEMIEATEMCLTSTLFIVKDTLYEHINGVAMGSPTSSIVVNLLMERFTDKLSSTAQEHP